MALITTAGDFRALLGLNALEVLTRAPAVTGNSVLKISADVQIGIRVEQVNDVDSSGEDFTVRGNTWMR